MIVTDRKYSLEPPLVEKLDLLCGRCSGHYNHQNVIICDGVEGYGKSTLTAACAYYMAYKMKRKLKLFFDLDELMKYAVEHEDEVLIWDDAAFAALSIEAYNRSIIKFIKVIWLARKKRHTYFINIQEVFRLKELLVSRAVALLHVYSPDEIRLGKMVYFSRKGKEYLYDDWSKRKYKSYKKFFTFRSTFPNVLNKIFDEKEYDNIKDAAILTINEDPVKKDDKTRLKLLNLRYAYATLDLPIEVLEKHAGIGKHEIYRWRKKEDIDAPVPLFAFQKDETINKGYIEPKPLHPIATPGQEQISGPITSKEVTK